MTPERLLAAAAVLAVYALLCGWIWRRERRRQRQAAAAAAALGRGGDGGPPLLLAWASQTGQAEELAWASAQALHAAGVATRLLPLGAVGAAELQAAERALFIASTYGEGDAPDNAAAFARRLMADEGDAPALHRLRIGVLALGDRGYAQFCGFGRRLDAWLRARGAQPLFERIDVHQSDPAALAAWRHELSHLAGTRDLPDWQAPAFEPWRLEARELLNPGSAGGPCFHLELAPAAADARADWQAGDLVQVSPPGEPDRPREYSIASVPADGRVHLVVRQTCRADGNPGLASGWLTAQAALGAEVPLRLRKHTGFRIGGNAQRPLILIGNGSGIGGLRGHWRQRAEARRQAQAGGQPLPPPCWLLFGERQAAHDACYDAEIRAAQDGGLLARVDRVYSRDGAALRYVQHALQAAAGELRTWIDARGAAVYVCGSLEGMAGGVDEALRAILGDAGVDALADAGRYRRDVY